MIFCGVKCKVGTVSELSYYISGVIQKSEASVEIAKFLVCPKELLGFVDFYPFPTYPPIAALGRGSTAICVSLQGNQALKVSRDQAALAIEREILNYLHLEAGEFSQLQIPKVFDYCSFSTVVAPVCSHPSSSLSLVQYLKAWDALRKVHKFGICHCDVRMPNLGVIGKTQNQTFYWIDWSSARPFRDIRLSNFSFQVGSTCTASIPVLKRMLEKRNDYVCFPSDEGISMIYLCWQQHCRRGDLNIPRPPEVAIDMWNMEVEKFPPIVADAITALEAIGQSYDDMSLGEVHGHVESALKAIVHSSSNDLPDISDLTIIEHDGDESEGPCK